VGVCYNVFDCEELLESSILSIREEAEHVCVVYQTTSNFGDPANPRLRDFLDDLQEKGLVDSLIFYEPRSFSESEKANLVTKHFSVEEMGCTPSEILDQFFNELTKRELGRLDCLKNGMSHFMSMDCDEYYLKQQLVAVKKIIYEKGYESTACRIRTFGKYPTVEYLRDDFNAVTLIHVLSPDKPFRLSAPLPVSENGRVIGLDPTRRIDNTDHNKFRFFQREEIEMYHMTLVRKDMRKKLGNVSNRHNYGNLVEFWEKWDAWTPELGTVIHPHPNIAKYFSRIQIVPNYFNIDLNNQCRICCKTRHVLMRCSVCKTAKYCSAECQREDWPKHKITCRPGQ